MGNAILLWQDHDANTNTVSLENDITSLLSFHEDKMAVLPSSTCVPGTKGKRCLSDS